MATEDEEAITKDLTLRIRSIRTALRGSEKAISQERELLKRLIELVTCPYSSVKIVVARNITAYIKSFEDLEDDAINAVYDLCEDQDPVVRIEGYRAITQVSSHLPKYVKRNADVLVQLLQSDEPTEVGVVEGQLLMHLDKDPTVTLNVLCDQIVPPEEPLDEEDQTVRDRLRSLVIEFMRGRAKRGIIRHADKSDSGPDTALVNRVLNSISRMNPSDIEILIKDIIVSLPAYTPGSARSLALVQALVDEAEACYRREWAEAQARHGVPLKQTQHFMALAYFISVEKRLTSPAPILQFWCPNKILESVLQQHEEEFRLFVFNNLGTYGFLEDGELDTETLSAIQSSIAAASVPLFSSFVNMPEEQKRPWNACRALLSACKEHASKTRWKVPQKLASLLQNVQSQADQEKDVVDAEGKKSLEQVQDLTLSLLETSNAPISASSRQGMSNDQRRANGGPVHIKRKFNEPATERPAQARNAPPSVQFGLKEAGRRQADPGVSNVKRPARQDQRATPQSRRNTPISTPASSSRGTPEASSGRKKLAAEGSVPSLLSRLALAGESQNTSSTTTIPAKRSADSDRFVNKRPNTLPAKSGGSATPPPGGWSIKGAASKTSHPPPASDKPVASLLNRLVSSDGDGNRTRGRRRSNKT